MKIAHLADIHQGSNYSGPFPSARFDDINRILDWTADRIIAEQVQLCLVSGDCFKDAKVMLDRASQEIASIVRFLRKLSDANIEVMVISGTPSHDAVAAYELIDQMRIPYIYIFTKPEVYYGGRPVSLACLPGLNRSALMTQDEYKGLPAEQVHRIMTDKISQLCMGMAAQMPDDKPKILMAHMTYQGAETGFTDLLMQNEPILTREAVAGFDLVCLGHIHRPQQIDGNVFYSGPIERLSFNEEGVAPGFYIYDIVDHNYPFISHFVPTPARRYETFEWDETCVLQFIKHGFEAFNGLFTDSVKDAIVRLRYSCSEDVAKQLNRKAIEKALYDAGAFFVSEIKADITRVDRARDNTVNESLGPIEALARYCDNQCIDPEESKMLCSMTTELLESGV